MVSRSSLIVQVDHCLIFVLIDLGTGEETVSVERTQVFVLQTVQMNTIPLQVELHQVRMIVFRLMNERRCVGLDRCRTWSGV